jgi:hypothetical protein
VFGSVRPHFVPVVFQEHPSVLPHLVLWVRCVFQFWQFQWLMEGFD